MFVTNTTMYLHYSCVYAGFILILDSSVCHLRRFQPTGGIGSREAWFRFLATPEKVDLARFDSKLLTIARAESKPNKKPVYVYV